MSQQMLTILSTCYHGCHKKFNLQLQYKSSALSLNVRPNKILQAANWLATNSILYGEAVEQGVNLPSHYLRSAEPMVLG